MGLPEVPPLPRQHSIWKISTLCGGLLGRCEPRGSLLGFAGRLPMRPRRSTATDASGLEEITVTAERYVSTIQNTPISISALSGQELQAQGITTIQEIAQDVPGLSMRSASPGLTEYEARGLASNGGAAPTVGFYLNEIPLSPPARVAVRQGGHRSRPLRRPARRSAARAAGHALRLGIHGRHGQSPHHSAEAQHCSRARRRPPARIPKAAAAMAAATSC